MREREMEMEMGRAYLLLFSDLLVSFELLVLACLAPLSLLPLLESLQKRREEKRREEKRREDAD